MDRQARQVDRFVAEVRARLNRQLGWRTLRWATLIGGGVMLLVALAYVLPGYAVPALWYAGVAAAALGGAAVAWALLAWSSQQTERFIDDFFDLDDSVSSLRGFERAGRRGGFFTLQEAQVQKMLAELDAGRVQPAPAGRVTAVAAAIVALAAGLALVGPSDEVVARQVAADRTLQQTQRMNEDLAQYVQEILDEADADVAELFDPSELRQWVDELEAMEDQQEALRQYAAFEREVNEMSRRLRQERDQTLLDEIAERLREQRETRELGEQLQRRQYRDAAEHLEQLSPQDLEDLQDLAEARENLDRLRKAAQRMAEAARQQRRPGEQRRPGGEDADGAAGAERLASAQGGERASGASGEADTDMSDGELADLIEQLDRDLETYDEALAECEAGGGEQARRLAQQRGDEAGQRLAQVRRRLQTLEDSRELRQRLAGLCEQLGICQSELAGQTQLTQQGGAEPGTGTVDSFANEQETPEDGLLTRLEGQRGDGPARTTVQDADSGTGVSGRASAEMEVGFQRQVESFVQREDVPRAVRDGVQRYFENIHDGPAEAEGARE